MSNKRQKALLPHLHSSLVMQVTGKGGAGWLLDQMEYRFADEIRESNWSHELKTILRTPCYEFTLGMDD